MTRLKQPIREPRAAWRKAASSAAELPKGVSAAAASSGTGFSGDEKQALKKFLSASHRVQREKASMEEAVHSKTGGAATRLPTKDEKTTLQDWMQSSGTSALELAPGHIALLDQKRATGTVRAETLKTAGSGMRVEDVRREMLAVLADVETEATTAAKRRRKTYAQRAAEARATGGGDEEEEDGGDASPRPGYAASEAVSTRQSVTASLSQAVEDSVTAVNRQTGKGADARSIMSKLSSVPSLAAAAGAVGTRKRARASLIGSQHNGDLDIASVIAEAVYRLMNPPTSTLGLRKTAGKQKEHLQPVMAAPSPVRSAAARIVDAREVSAARAAERKAFKEAQQKRAAGGDAVEEGEEGVVSPVPSMVGGGDVPAPPPPSTSAEGGDDDDDDDLGHALQHKSSFERAKQDMEDLSETVGQLIMQRAGAEGKSEVKLQVRNPATGAVDSVTLRGRESKKTVKPFTWSRLTRALRGAVAAALLEHTDVDPSLPCRAVLSKDPTLFKRAVTGKVLRDAIQGLRQGSDAFQEAHTVSYIQTTVLREKDKAKEEEEAAKTTMPAPSKRRFVRAAGGGAAASSARRAVIKEDSDASSAPAAAAPPPAPTTGARASMMRTLRRGPGVSAAAAPAPSSGTTSSFRSRRTTRGTSSAR